MGGTIRPSDRPAVSCFTVTRPRENVSGSLFGDLHGSGRTVTDLRKSIDVKMFNNKECWKNTYSQFAFVVSVFRPLILSHVDQHNSRQSLCPFRSIFSE